LQRLSNDLKLSALSVSSIHQLKKKKNNDHLILSSNLKHNKVIVSLSVLIDIEVIDYAFIDDFFAHQIHLSCFSLSESCILQKLDDNLIVFKFITHYAFANLQVSDDEAEETFFYVI